MKHLKTQQTPDIDWSKPMWVIRKNDPIQIILTNGVHDGTVFSGTCLPCPICPNGAYDASWSKSLFVPLTGTIMFPISNEYEI